MIKKIFFLIFLIFSTKSFCIEIESSKEISLDPGAIFDLEYLIKNNLDDLKSFKTDIDLTDDFEILNEVEKEFQIDNQKLISYSIKAPENVEKKDYEIKLDLKDENENELDSYTSNIHIKENPFKNDQITTPSLDSNTTYPSSYDIAKDETNLENRAKTSKDLPIITSFGYGLNESPNGTLFLETSGSKILNEKLNNNLEFALKLPLMQEGVIPKKVDGKPERFYVGYKTPIYSVLVGDTAYNMSPLTITSHAKNKDTPAPFGRGALVEFNRKKLGLGILYLTKPPFKVSNSRDTILGFLSYKILNNKFTSTILNTSYKKPKDGQDKNEMTYSFRSTYDEKDSLYDFEYALSSFNAKKDAYFVKARDKISIFSFGLDGLYSKPKYPGYLSDTFAIDSNVGFDLTNNLSTNGEYKLKQTNLDKNTSLDKADRRFSTLAKLSYTAPFKLSSNIGFESIQNKDVLKTDKGYKLNKTQFHLKQPIKKFSLESTLEKGIFKAREERYLKRDFNQMQFQINYEPFEKQTISIYTKHGNFIDSDLFNFGHIYGAKTSIKKSDDFVFSLLYEFTNFKRKTSIILDASSKIKKSHKIDGSLDWTLPTHHVVQFKAKFDPSKFSTKTSEIGLSYSIPYDVPWLDKKR